jgi:simple sugar transport system substrate-binding protein
MKLILSKSKRATAVVAAGLVVVATATGCAQNNAGGRAADDDLKITVVSGPLADPFFSAMKKGAEQAAEDLGVSVEWTAPKDFSNVGPDYSRLGDAALAGSPDGVALTYFLPESQLPSLEKMVEQDIPVTFLNSGPDSGWQELGALNNIGEDPTLVGTQVGQRFLEAGKKRVLCVNHGPGVEPLQMRCDALKTVMEGDGAQMVQVDIPMADSTNPTAISNAIAGALRADPAIDAVFTLGSTVAENAARVIEEQASDAMLATTDLSTNVLKLIDEGKIAFASDQQPWLSGYYAVQILVNYVRYGIHPIGQIDTAPNWITQDNARETLEISEANDGLRGAA